MKKNKFNKREQEIIQTVVGDRFICTAACGHTDTAKDLAFILKKKNKFTTKEVFMIGCCLETFLNEMGMPIEEERVEYMDLYYKLLKILEDDKKCKTKK